MDMAGSQSTIPCATLCEAFQRTAAVAPNAVALRTPGDGVRVSWADYAHRVRRIAAGLAGFGVTRGDTVALMLTNRPEFHLVDTAAIHLGATPFSIYNTNSPEQINYAVTHAESRVVVCESQYVKQIRDAGCRIDHLVCVDADIDGGLSLRQLEEAGDAGFDFDAAWKSVEPNDVATLIYTSGTTGPPKAVELTHANLLAQLRAAHQIFDFRFGDRMTSYLPSAHIADRLTSHYVQLGFATQVTCVADGRAIAEALPETRPTIWFAVPRIWEKLKLAIESSLDECDTTAAEFGRRAIETGLSKVRAEQANQPVPPALDADYREADQHVLAPLRRRFGLDQLRWAMSGAAPVAPEVLLFFLALGVQVCEVWGMSETVGAATVNPPTRIKVGTVGLPLPGLQLRIADDGEALLRGEIVMRGYRKDPHRTAEVLDADGWLHTGDVITQDEDGYVKVIDRKKALIINAAGKNMSPSNIENTVMASCSAIGNVIVIGDGRPYNVALVVLEPETTAAICRQHHITDLSSGSLASNPVITSIVDAGVQAANKRLSRVEQIKRFHILPDQWVPGSQELTPTLKLRRKWISEKYADQIDELYRASQPVCAGS
jgi:long-chain acyl-CoA synthetase